jgi:hypothetical protein
MRLTLCILMMELTDSKFSSKLEITSGTWHNAALPSNVHKIFIELRVYLQLPSVTLNSACNLVKERNFV